jgi:hypothetical protein
MTGPEGDKSHGWWRILAVDAPHLLEIQDGFADDSGVPNPDMPLTTMRVVLSEEGGVTQMVTTAAFPSLEAMQQLETMGMRRACALQRPRWTRSSPTDRALLLATHLLKPNEALSCAIQASGPDQHRRSTAITAGVPGQPTRS